MIIAIRMRPLGNRPSASDNDFNAVMNFSLAPTISIYGLPLLADRRPLLVTCSGPRSGVGSVGFGSDRFGSEHIFRLLHAPSPPQVPKPNIDRISFRGLNN